MHGPQVSPIVIWATENFPVAPTLLLPAHQSLVLESSVELRRDLVTPQVLFHSKGHPATAGDATSIENRMGSSPPSNSEGA